MQDAIMQQCTKSFTAEVYLATLHQLSPHGLGDQRIICVAIATTVMDDGVD